MSREWRFQTSARWTIDCASNPTASWTTHRGFRRIGDVDIERRFTMALEDEALECNSLENTVIRTGRSILYLPALETRNPQSIPRSICMTQFVHWLFGWTSPVSARKPGDTQVNPISSLSFFDCVAP